MSVYKIAFSSIMFITLLIVQTINPALAMTPGTTTTAPAAAPAPTNDGRPPDALAQPYNTSTAVCGNGVCEAGEQCDNGSGNCNDSWCICTTSCTTNTSASQSTPSAGGM